MSASPLTLGNFRENGCLVVERLFDPALIDRVREEYERQYADRRAAHSAPHMEVGDGRLHLPVALRGPLLDAMFLFHPLLHSMLVHLMPSRLVLDSVSVVTSFPGSSDQRPHRDHSHLFEEDGVSAALPPAAIAVAIPLVDLTEETGGTRLFPGTIDGRDTDDFGNQPAVLPLLERGGCYLYDYRLYHAGLANRSAKPRPILFASFARHWFIDETNYKNHARLVISREDLASISADKRLLFARLAAPGSFDASLSELMD